MKIYTRGGDQGQTGLLGGERTSKADPRVERYGDVDELNAHIGLLVSLGAGRLDEWLYQVQRELFEIGAELASTDNLRKDVETLTETAVSRLESQIDEMEGELAPLTRFVLPGGSPQAAQAHVARTVCRRAERRIIATIDSNPVRLVIVQYMNRLSDFLFVAARYLNHMNDIGDVEWESGFVERRKNSER